MRILILFTLSLNLFAEDFNPRTDIIADNYEAGPYLIYDCQEKHWTCVSEPFYRNCEEQRKKSTQESLDVHPCAPIGLFPTKKSCYQRILFLTTHNHGNRFCIKEDLRTKAFKFDE